MSTLSAFHGAAEARIAALQRLAVHIAAGHLTVGPMAWDGEKGSLVGCLIDSNDPQAWEDRLGLAKWLAHAADAVTGSLAPALVLQKATELLNAIPPGQDTGPLGSLLIGRLLTELAAAQQAPLPPQLQAALDQVNALHQRSLAGNSIEAATWKAVRQAALAATDTLDQETEPRLHAIGAAIEAAAWDPQRSALAVADTLRQWLALERLKADSEFGWTEHDDANIRRLLARMHNEFKLPHPDEPRDVFLLLEEHHPDDASRLRAYMKFGRDHSTACAARAADMLTRLLAAQS